MSFYDQDPSARCFEVSSPANSSFSFFDDSNDKGDLFSFKNNSNSNSGAYKSNSATAMNPVSNTIQIQTQIPSTKNDEPFSSKRVRFEGVLSPIQAPDHIAGEFSASSRASRASFSSNSNDQGKDTAQSKTPYSPNQALETKLHEAEMKFIKLSNVFLSARSCVNEIEQANSDIIATLFNIDLTLICDYDSDDSDNSNSNSNSNCNDGGMKKVDYLVKYERIFALMKPFEIRLRDFGHKL